MPAFSQARLNRRRAASKYSFSRTRTLGIETSSIRSGLGTRPGPRGPAAGKRTANFRERELELQSMRVLGIESSCDETAVAVYDAASGLVAHEIYSQVHLHAAYGGVVPELASRDH